MHPEIEIADQVDKEERKQCPSNNVTQYCHYTRTLHQLEKKIISTHILILWCPFKFYCFDQVLYSDPNLVVFSLCSHFSFPGYAMTRPHAAP